MTVKNENPPVGEASPKPHAKRAGIVAKTMKAIGKVKPNFNKTKKRKDQMELYESSGSMDFNISELGNHSNEGNEESSEASLSTSHLKESALRSPQNRTEITNTPRPSRERRVTHSPRTTENETGQNEPGMHGIERRGEHLSSPSTDISPRKNGRHAKGSSPQKKQSPMKIKEEFRHRVHASSTTAVTIEEHSARSTTPTSAVDSAVQKLFHRKMDEKQEEAIKDNGDSFRRLSMAFGEDDTIVGYLSKVEDLRKSTASSQTIETEKKGGKGNNIGRVQSDKTSQLVLELGDMLSPRLGEKPRKSPSLRPRHTLDKEDALDDGSDDDILNILPEIPTKRITSLSQIRRMMELEVAKGNISSPVRQAHSTRRTGSRSPIQERRDLSKRKKNTNKRDEGALQSPRKTHVDSPKSQGKAKNQLGSPRHRRHAKVSSPVQLTRKATAHDQRRQQDQDNIKDVENSYGTSYQRPHSEIEEGKHSRRDRYQTHSPADLKSNSASEPSSGKGRLSKSQKSQPQAPSESARESHVSDELSPRRGSSRRTPRGHVRKPEIHRDREEDRYSNTSTSLQQQSVSSQKHNLGGDNLSMRSRQRNHEDKSSRDRNVKSSVASREGNVSRQMPLTERNINPISQTQRSMQQSQSAGLTTAEDTLPKDRPEDPLSENKTDHEKNFGAEGCSQVSLAVSLDRQNHKTVLSLDDGQQSVFTDGSDMINKGQVSYDAIRSDESVDAPQLIIGPDSFSQDELLVKNA